MPLFSSALDGKNEANRRRLYTLFQRAVKAGELPALKLLDRFPLTGSKGQARQVFEYAYPKSAEPQVKAWIDQHEGRPTAQGLTIEHVQAMTDDQLTALIKAQRKPGKRRARRKGSAPTNDGGEDAS